MQTREDIVAVVKLSLKDFGSHGQNAAVRVYRKKEKAFVALLTESVSFVSSKVNVFVWILLLFQKSFFTNTSSYQVIHCIDRKYGRRIAIER